MNKPKEPLQVHKDSKSEMIKFLKEKIEKLRTEGKRLSLQAREHCNDRLFEQVLINRANEKYAAVFAVQEVLEYVERKY